MVNGNTLVIIMKGVAMTTEISQQLAVLDIFLLTQVAFGLKSIHLDKYNTGKYPVVCDPL
jgi:hypothetical protein